MKNSFSLPLLLPKVEILKHSTEESTTHPTTKIKRNKKFELKNIYSTHLHSQSTEVGNLISDGNQLIETQQNRVHYKLFGKDQYRIFQSLQNDVRDNKHLSPTGNLQPTIYNSKDSPKQFFSKFKKFQRVTTMNRINELSPTFAFIKSINNHKVIPNPIGLINRNEDNTKVQLGNSRVGDNYIKALSKGIEKVNYNFKELQLKSARLSSLGANYLFTSLNKNRDLISNIINLDLSNNKLGSDDLHPMITYFKDKTCAIEILNLEGNKLGDDNIIQIAEALGDNTSTFLISINFAKNRLSDASIPSITKLIGNSSDLKVLILNWNRINNKGGTMLINAIKNHTELKMLDIAWNNIGTYLTQVALFEEIVMRDKNPQRDFFNFDLKQSCINMKLFISKNPLIPKEEKSVVPSNNKKKSQENNKNEAINLIPKLKEIKLAIPPHPASPFARELADYFKSTTMSLIHLDISHNNISSEDAEHISNEVKNNHSILGIHLDGNEMTIDALGFIAPIKTDKQEAYYAKSQIFYDLTDEACISKSNMESSRRIRSKNKCWICEGWREIEFVYYPSNPTELTNFSVVKIHLNFDGWKPYDVISNGNKYSIVRMCPPGTIYYFYTIDMVAIGDYSKDEVTKLFPNDSIKYTFTDDYMEEYYNVKLMMNYSMNPNDDNGKDAHNNKSTINNDKNLDTNQIVNKPSIAEATNNSNPNRQIVVTTLGKKVIKKNSSVINNHYRKTLMFCEPRPVRIFNRFIKPRTPWKFPISIWASYDYSYEGDTEDYLTQCFEHDFQRCQFEKDFKEEEELIEVKELLRKNYTDILCCYKTLSSFSGFTLWQISQSSLIEFVSKCQGLCDKKYDINNVFLVQTGICANSFDKEERVKNGNKNLCDNIIRHQFLALLVKVPRDKYVRVLKTISNTLDAIKYAFENHFEAAIKGYSYHRWRIERYYNEEVDNFIKAYIPIFDAVYKSWAKQKGPRKKDVWMVLDEYNTLVQALVDTNEYPFRENPLFFNLSLRLQVSEITSDKHINMFFPEFLEGICRAIDKASPFPQEDIAENWPMQKRIAQPLITKLENSIDKLIQVITHPDFKGIKEKFTKPTKDQMTNLYNIDYSNVFYQGFNFNKQEKCK